MVQGYFQPNFDRKLMYRYSIRILLVAINLADIGKPGYWGYAVGGVVYVPQGREWSSRARISAGDKGAKYWEYVRVDPAGNGSSDLP